MDDTELHVGMDAPAEEADGEQTIGVLLRRTDNSDRTPEVTIELYQDGTLIDTLADELEIEDPVGEVHHFNFDADDLVDPSGEDVTVELSAPGTGGPPGDRNTAEYGAVEWDVDTIIEGGDNLITWDASPDDPDELNHYNVYRAEEEDGDYEFIGDVEVEGSDEYEYIDEGAGTEDETLWYYEVEAEDESDQTSERAGPEREPGPLVPTDPQPEDGATIEDQEQVELSVHVEHSEEEIIDKITFYDASDDTEIDSLDDVEHGTRTDDVVWEDLEQDNTYEWFTIAEGKGGDVESEIWEFTTQSQEYEVNVSAPEDAVENDHDIYTYEFTVENKGGIDDTYDIEAISQNPDIFPIVDQPDEIVVESGQTEKVEIDVEITEYAESGDTTTITLMATSQNEQMVFDEDSMEITAQFEEEVEYTLYVGTTEGGEVVDPGEGEFTYDEGTEVDLEAVADQDYLFVEWTGDTGTIEDPTANDTTITMEGDHSITANFDETQIDEVLIYSDKDKVEAGEELKFDAEALDEDGQVREDDPTEFEWQNAVDGVFHETETGDYGVTATYQGVTSEITTVTVEPASPSQIDIVDNPHSIRAGDGFEITVNVTDDYDNPADDRVVEKISVDSEHDGNVYTEENITLGDEGQYTAVISEGQIVSSDEDHTITVSFNSSASFQMTVQTGDSDRLEIEPEEDKEIEPGTRLEFEAAVYDEYGNLITEDVSDFEWENIDEIDEESNVAIFNESETGEYEITATYDGLTALSVTVEIEEVTEDPSSSLTRLRGLWWLWLVAVLMIFFIGGSYWKKSKRDADKSDPGVKVVRRELKKASDSSQDEMEISKEEGSEEVIEETERGEEPMEEQRYGSAEDTGGEEREVEEDLSDEEPTEETSTSSKEISKSEAIEELQKVKGVGPTTAKNMYEEDFETLAQLKEASVEELTEVKGIGEATAEKIFDNLKD